MSGTSTVSFSLVSSISSSCGFEERMHSERDVGVFGGVGGDLGDRHFVHSLLVAAFADELVDLDRRVIEILLGEVVEVVAAAAGVEQVAGDHRVESDAGKR